MRGATVATVLLGLLAVVSAGDVSEPKHLSGRLSCLLPIAKMRCVRDWRSGFVAGLSYGYDLPLSDVGNVYTQVCSNVINNQTRFQMFTATGSNSVRNAQRDAPAWYKTDAAGDADYFMPAGALITQVIVLHAHNPWGDKFGTIPAVIFAYLNPNRDGLLYATCGNALYSNAYLSPETSPAPPTTVSLKASYSSGLSEEHEKLTVLGGFDGKCATRGTQFVAYHGGDPWKSSKFYLKQMTKPCFVPFDKVNVPILFAPPTPTPTPVPPPSCPEDKPLCNAGKCFYDKKSNKKSPSFSCASTGLVVATGKYGLIHFDEHGEEYEYAPDAQGKLQMVKTKASEAIIEGDAMPEEADEP